MPCSSSAWIKLASVYRPGALVECVTAAAAIVINESPSCSVKTCRETYTDVLVLVDRADSVLTGCVTAAAAAGSRALPAFNVAGCAVMHTHR